MTDPSGPLGLLLGIPGLVVACADIYRQTLIARRLDKDGMLVLTQVAIEQAKFHDWILRLGVVDNNNRAKISFTPMTGNIVRSAMEGIRIVLKDLGEIIDKYELDEGGEVNSLNFWLPDRFWQSAPKSTDTPLPDPQFQVSARRRLLDRVNKKVKSMKWAVADMEQSRRLIEDLRNFNEDLRYLVQSPLRSVPSTLPSKVLPQVLELGQLDTLMAATMEEYPELGLCASFKAKSLQIARDKEIPVARSNILSCQRQSLSVPLSSLDMQRHFLQYTTKTEKINVLLESKPYHTNQDTAYEKFVHKRVFEIAQLLAQTPKPKHFGTLDCLGYLQDRPRNRFCFIFRLADGFDYTSLPVSLKNVFGDGSAAVQKPSLGVRFQMALSISLSLLYMHACGIVHKAYHAENLLLFRKEGEGTLCLESPTLLGFDFARPHGDFFASESIAQLSTDPARLYVHPDYKPEEKARYLKVYDLYSLGILLLEIGLWEGAGRVIPENSPRQAARESLITHAAAMRSVMGDIYVDVVLRCLTGDIRNEDTPTQVAETSINDEREQDDIELQRSFVHNIVEPLSRCCA